MVEWRNDYAIFLLVGQESIMSSGLFAPNTFGQDHLITAGAGATLAYGAVSFGLLPAVGGSQISANLAVPVALVAGGATLFANSAAMLIKNQFGLN